MAQREVRRYFVVHRGSGGTQILAQLCHGAPHRNLLDPFLSQLVHERADGILLLVDADTRELVLRCPIEDVALRRNRSLNRIHRFWLL